MKVIDLARMARDNGLLIVITRDGKTKLRRHLKPGDTRIAVKLKEAA
jgi:hypothetical protein